MSEQREADMFRACQPWLARQEGMDPWEDGCRELRRHLAGWVEDYSNDVCEAPITEDMPEQSRYIARLWKCLAHHWAQAVGHEESGCAPVADVAQRLREGCGWKKGGKLGGDPMRDVVLAQAMTLRDGNAPVVFTDEYRGYCTGIAVHIETRLRNDQWWNDLLDHLAGYSKPPGKLDRFAGGCALKNWLGVTVFRFILKWKSQEFKALPPDQIGEREDRSDVADDVAMREAAERLAGLTGLALQRMPREDVLLLALLFIDGGKQKTAATILGVHSGNVGRRRQKALERLQKELQIVAEEQRGISLSGLEDDVLADPKLFAAAMCEALQKARRDLQ